MLKTYGDMVVVYETQLAIIQDHIDNIETDMPTISLQQLHKEKIYLTDCIEGLNGLIQKTKDHIEAILHA